ncbi:MAG: group II intron reverse transcriptase/maturase [Nitrososphaera sp.]|nr:group II intron reverse transcriptase/maturase [Nitrososphaera sp.]
MQTSLQGIAQKAKTQKKYRFRNLYGALNEAYLHDCWRDIRKQAAYGVDKVSAEEYERNLSVNIKGLVERLKQKRYHAKLVRRKYIPKENGKERPLGIPTVEDKLLQIAVAEILKAIYEQDFFGFSYGYRPQVGVHEASEAMMRRIQFGAFGWIVEADIKGYFDNIDHEWLIRMLEERIDDRAFTRLIRKWLKAGILERDGKVLHPVTGTPQGGVVSPVLANIYLHYVLDLWFEKHIKRQLQRKGFLIRYADDFVCGFERQSEAASFLEKLRERLKKFGLELSEEKTRVIEFKRNRGGGKRFDFLGFEYFWSKHRDGRILLRRRTSRKKLRSSLKRFAEWCKANRHYNLGDLLRKLNAKLRGYYNHYGVVGNFESLKQFYRQMMLSLHRWLNRRSQRRGMTWEKLHRLKDKYGLMQPNIMHQRQPVQLKLR